MFIAWQQGMRSSQTRKYLVESGAIVSLAGAGIGVVLNLEQWTHHPHNSRHLSESRHVLSRGHAAPGTQPYRPFH